MRNGNMWRLIALSIAPALAGAQWLNYPTPGIPRTPDGKPKLSAPAPRAADGKPDLSGLWQTESAPREVLARLLPGGANGGGEDAPSQYFLNILYDFKPEEAPLRPGRRGGLPAAWTILHQGVSTLALPSRGLADRRNQRRLRTKLSRPPG